jgi:diadenosine tetraphosphate (Ap4A) HIT family hydrolase
MREFERVKVDWEALDGRARTEPCFICRIVARDPDFPAHHIVYEDDIAIAFLDKYPKMYGYTLVAPRDHREQVTGDFTAEEYLALQRVVHRVAEAVRLEVGAARLYLISLGSNEGNSHVHWHIAPLPPGVPYERQQGEALRADPFDIPEEEQSSLAHRLRQRLGQPEEGLA